MLYGFRFWNPESGAISAEHSMQQKNTRALKISLDYRHHSRDRHHIPGGGPGISDRADGDLRTYPIILLVCAILLLPAVANAEDVAELKKKLMFDQKKLIVMENMEFTTDEGKFFWPIYKKFQEELFEVNQGVVKLVVAYAASYQTLSNETAAIISEDWLNLQEKRNGLFEKYLKELSKGLPAKKVFRYLQIENKLDAIARYELAKKIPLAQ
jgi:hypothetical protein